MYKVLITKELKQYNYFKLIDYAFSKSDACMLVVYRDIGDMELMFNGPPDLSLSEEIREIILDSNKKAKKEKYNDMAIFQEKTEPFLEKLNPYLIKKRNFPTEWPGVKVVLNEYMNVDICVYKICDELRKYLLEPRGLFNWRYPYFPDDLSFFCKGYCWFTTIAHDEYACMYIDSYDDIKILKELDIEFEETKCNESHVNLFYEDYKL